jgi:hypothetical protein
VPRSWVKIGKKIYCCTTVSSTCYQAQLASIAEDRRLAAATEKINGTLKDVQAPPGQELVIIAITDKQGEDVLALEWAYVDEEVVTYEDKELVSE